MKKQLSRLTVLPFAGLVAVATLPAGVLAAENPWKALANPYVGGQYPAQQGYQPAPAPQSTFDPYGYQYAPVGEDPTQSQTGTFGSYPGGYDPYGGYSGQGMVAPYNGPGGYPGYGGYSGLGMFPGMGTYPGLGAYPYGGYPLGGGLPYNSYGLPGLGGGMPWFGGW